MEQTLFSVGLPVEVNLTLNTSLVLVGIVAMLSAAIILSKID